MFPRQVVLASGNPGKLREMGELLAQLQIELLPQSQFSIADVEETGLSFVENAILKARHASGHTGLPALADDSGIQVDVLGGAPGIYSARYAGEGAGDDANLKLLIERVKELNGEHTPARFQCAMVYVRDALDAMPVIAQGTWDGHIITAPRGSNGFGYDPVFYLPGHDCTSAQLPPEEKNRLSHRGLAMRGLVSKLATIVKEGEGLQT